MTGPDLRQWRRVPHVVALLCGAYNYLTDMGYSTEQTLTVLEHESAENHS